MSLTHAAGLGSIAGAVLAMLERKPLMPHMAGTAASTALCMSFYGGNIQCSVYSLQG